MKIIYFASEQAVKYKFNQNVMYKQCSLKAEANKIYRFANQNNVDKLASANDKQMIIINNENLISWDGESKEVPMKNHSNLSRDSQRKV